MSESFPWYVSVSAGQLEQGDFLSACPLFQVRADGTFSHDTAHAVVLSHSCDLANEKLEIVQVCPVWPLEGLAEHVEYLRSRRGREDLRRGNLPGYHLLNRCELAGLETDFLVLDFRSLFGIPLTTARELAQSQSPRRRLLPPYREHMAQAFARFFMRVGLPVDIPAF
jgi:hypothetical protein